MTPVILATVVIMWQAVLIGYTFVLAGNAADKAAHAAAIDGGDCATAGQEDLPAAWRGAAIGCADDGDLVKAHVDLKVPLLFPGLVTMSVTVPGTAAAAKEEPR